MLTYEAKSKKKLSLLVSKQVYELYCNLIFNSTMYISYHIAKLYGEWKQH